MVSVAGTPDPHRDGTFAVGVSEDIIMKPFASRTGVVAGIGLTLLVLLPAPVHADRLIVWGDDSANQVSDAPDGPIRAVDGGSFNGLAIRLDGSPAFWGYNPNVGPPPMPAEIAAERYRAVALGRDDAVLIRRDGTLAAWGKNQPIVDLLPGAFRAATVASVHAVAIADDGSLVAWGSDSYQLPTGEVTGLLNAPRGRPFKAVDARVLYSMALHENGTLYGWGHGTSGGNVLENWTPTREDPDIFFIPRQTFIAIAAGNEHALAIRPDGSVTGWGDDSNRALQPPARVAFKAVSAGWGFSVGIASDGTLWGWGVPEVLPNVTAPWTFETLGWKRFDRTEHFYVPRMRFKSLAAGAFHVMAITDDT